MAQIRIWPTSLPNEEERSRVGRRVRRQMCHVGFMEKKLLDGHPEFSLSLPFSRLEASFAPSILISEGKETHNDDQDNLIL